MYFILRTLDRNFPRNSYERNTNFSENSNSGLKSKNSQIRNLIFQVISVIGYAGQISKILSNYHIAVRHWRLFSDVTIYRKLLFILHKWWHKTCSRLTVGKEFLLSTDCWEGVSSNTVWQLRYSHQRGLYRIIIVFGKTYTIKTQDDSPPSLEDVVLSTSGLGPPPPSIRTLQHRQIWTGHLTS